MPRTDQQNQTIREESRAKILASALALFAQHGYEQTSVRMIAQAAGISQGLMYNYFESKEQLLVAIFEQSMGDVRESFARAEDPADPRPQIERLIRAAFAIVRDNMQFWRLSYSVRLQIAVVAELGEQIRLWSDAIRQTLEGYFRAAGVAAPQIEAAILFATLDGTAQHYVLNPEHYPIDTIENALVARYVTGNRQSSIVNTSESHV